MTRASRHPVATVVIDAVFLVASLPWILVLAAGLTWVGRSRRPR